MSLTIRLLEYKDLRGLREIRNECRDLLHNSKELSLDDVEDWYFNTNPTFFVLEGDGVMLGYFRTTDWSEYKVTVGLDLHKNYRGLGYAKPAFKLMFSHLRSEGIKRVGGRLLGHNYVAMSLLRELGFEIISEEELYCPERHRTVEDVHLEVLI